MSKYKMFKMKFTLMLLLSCIWLHGNACQMTHCSHQISAQSFLQANGDNTEALFTEFKSLVANAQSSNPIDIVVIDPGHGGRDKGCSGIASIEKEITLQIAKKLKAAINAQMPDIKVLMTRKKDVFVSLKNRAALANDNQADIFISVHCNYLRSTSKFRGSETYILGAEPEDEASENIAIRENKSITYEESYRSNYTGFDPFSSESFIMLSMMQNLYFNNSIILAQLVDSELTKSTTVQSHGVKQGAFVVLKETNMPSILVETGYLSNSYDEELLISSIGQDQVAQGLLNAITLYKHSID